MLANGESMIICALQTMLQRVEKFVLKEIGGKFNGHPKSNLVILINSGFRASQLQQTANPERD